VRPTTVQVEFATRTHAMPLSLLRFVELGLAVLRSAFEPPAVLCNAFEPLATLSS
jgi:hypothetical protein